MSKAQACRRLSGENLLFLLLGPCLKKFTNKNSGWEDSSVMCFLYKYKDLNLILEFTEKNQAQVVPL